MGTKCLVYKKVSLMSYVMNHTKSDIKGFVCIFVLVDRLTKLLPGLFMIVLLCKYTLFHPIPDSNWIIQNWTDNMQNYDIFAKKIQELNWKQCMHEASMKK